MDTLKILQSSNQANWDDDDEADALYLSVGEPRPGVGIDSGDGVSKCIVRVYTAGIWKLSAYG